MTYLDLATGLIKQNEGCRLTGYPDTGGIPTDGYGNTHGARIGVQITQEIADRDLLTNLQTADSELQKQIGNAVLTDHQRATLLDFVFNLGAAPSWSIWADIRNGKLDEVPAQLMRFDHGKVDGQLVEIPGLEHRRAAEVTYWRTADLAQAAAVIAASPVPQPSSSYTRPLDTPPAPTPPPVLNNTSLTTKIVGAVGALGAAATQVHGIVAPHADEAHLFAMLATGATGVVVAASILLLLIHAEQAHTRAN